MRVDPAIVADEVMLEVRDSDRPAAGTAAGGTSDDIRAAFGE
jgi:hypothetical protein